MIQGTTSISCFRKYIIIMYLFDIFLVIGPILHRIFALHPRIIVLDQIQMDLTIVMVLDHDRNRKAYLMVEIHIHLICKLTMVRINQGHVPVLVPRDLIPDPNHVHHLVPENRHPAHPLENLIDP